MNLELLAKKNQDESYSVSVKAADLVKYGFVDFYDDVTGMGYQRQEPQRTRRGKEIADYMERCVQQGLPPRLFELTANARCGPNGISFDPLDENGDLGLLNINSLQDRWMSIIDGGTRLLGIETALAHSIISSNFTLDVRLFSNLSIAEEVAQFLLINEKQKRVRTDLSLRVVQRKLDQDELSEEEKGILQTVVPESDSWRFEASRISGMMNSHPRSPWKGLIQMPNDKVTRPIKLQAYFSSLKSLLTNPDLDSHFEKIRKQQNNTSSKAEIITQILRNFWNAAKAVNPQAFEEPQTNVLWGSIGANGCHMALSEVLLSILNSNRPDLKEERFITILEGTLVSDYNAWYSRPGKKPEESYPGEKGRLPQQTGAANYVRLSKELEKEWRASIHADAHTGKVLL